MMTQVDKRRQALCKAIVEHDSFAGMLSPVVLKAIDSLVLAAEGQAKAPVPVVYGIFTAGERGTLLSQVQDRADSGHCDIHYSGRIEKGKRYGLILLPDKGKYISAPVLKEEKP